LAGYVYHPAGGPAGYDEGLFVQSTRRAYDFQTAVTGRGLITGTLDPLDNATTVTYDAYSLLLRSVTDPALLVTTAEHDYRVLQPRKITMPNGSTTELEFTPLGLLEATWVKGAAGEGDQVRPSTRFEYDFLAYAASPPAARRPILVRTIRHIHHDTDGVPQP
jgi:YD repeat-containing protein